MDYGTKRDDASIYSTTSTTSSVFSTASKISRFPSAVKSSVKYLVRRNKHKEDHESLGSKIKRTTIQLNPFRKQDTTHHEIIPTPYYTTHTTLQSKPTISRQNSTKVTSRPTDKQDDFDFLLLESDSKSEKMVAKKREEPWMRQRAKSCQENNTPMLHQLATKGSSTKIVVDLPQNAGPVPYKANHKPLDLPLFQGLVTTTLTTLHTRLTNECDRIIAMTLWANSNPTSNEVSPKEHLLSIISDLYKMSSMIHWQHRQKEDQVKQNIQQLEKMTQDELNLILVKDSVAIAKQIMNECICQYYGTVEKAIVIPTKGYRIEGINKYGDLNSIQIMPKNSIDYTQSPIDHKDTEAQWYRTHFMNQPDALHLFGYDQDKEPVLISIKREPETEDHPNQFRTIYRTQKYPDQRKVWTDTDLWHLSLKEMVEKVASEVSLDQFSELKGEQMMASGLQDELVRLDENSLHTKYKFGVLLVKEGQTKEEEWFSNENDSEAFHEFLDIIGRRIELQGYTGWAAGLDTKGGDSGEFSYINEWNENSLAYHVSTLIPSKAGDRQQIQRKRHIGNDIVCLVFVEGNQPFNPTAIKSQFLHVFIIVHKEILKNKTHVWRVEVVSIEDVPTFGPPLPSQSAVFFDKKELEGFLVAKLVNAEYAAFKSPKFAIPMNRAREGILSNLVEKGISETEQPKEEVEEEIKQHRKSASTSSQGSLSPSPSKSNVIREFSENIVNLAEEEAHKI
ncbi:Signal-induced proliferation-associated 1-like protein 1 [Choanephora cucurbitarum]|uniref:Signal-induced proliferation-associated 1-like protein 1 n=1 Tax=Choanephora cucurbitarum TaxID=101091 RepID=A0A1C7NDB1_9FUNG|nr:Signal-induced proliferation-associated 1-like protein 1 [Choanephora cucurbitarum]